MGRERARRRGNELLLRDRAGDREHGDHHAEASEEHRDGGEHVVEDRVRSEPTEGAAVVVRGRGHRVEDLAEAVRAGVRDALLARLGDHRDRGEDEHDRSRDEDDERRHLHLVGLDLLAEVLRGAADHEARHEDRDDGEDEHAVEPGADAAEDDLAELDEPHRHEAAERRERVVHPVHRAAGRAGGHGGEERGRGDPEADLLTLHVAAALESARDLIDGQAAERSIAGLLGGHAEDEQRDEDREHRGEHGPALPRVAHELAERVAKRAGDQEDREHLEHVREAGGVLERMRRVRVEEAASVRADLLDCDLRGRRADRDDLVEDDLAVRVLRRLQERDGLVGRERLHDALRDEQERHDNRERQEHVEHAPREVEPEVPDRRRGLARERSNERNDDRHRGGRRHEVLHGERRHLDEVAHRRFAAVRLPVRVRHEADRRIERQVGRDRRHRLRIRRQRSLHALEQVDEQDARDVEEESANGVRLPRHLRGGVDTEESVDEALDGTEHLLRGARLSFVDARHVRAQRLHAREEDDEEQDDLRDALRAHWSDSGFSIAKNR